MRIGSDTGGTFTDLVAADGTVVKVPSTPDDPGRAVRDGLVELAGRVELGGVAPVDVLAHGTTVGTNALLERRGAHVALVTTRGFADVIEIGRQDRPSLYDQTVDRAEPLVARADRHEVAGRLDATGDELEPADVAEVDRLALAPGVEAVAVVLLHADLDPSHEQAVAAVLREQGLDVTASHEVSPEFREVERTTTTVINVALRPVCRTYLQSLAGAAEEVLAMTSAGGLVPAAEAAERPVELLLSGPAGGVRAGAAAAVANGWPDAVTFDMGGTSTDVCLVLDGAPAPAAEREVAGYAVRVPALDVHTIGAGGGSIARLDVGGALVVGPDSAGAVPGPVCYGRGGTRPTVTDADLAAGRLPAGMALPGIGVLDGDVAARALEAAGVTAEGVLAVVEANMVQALRRVSVERGVDPRRLALVAFGGAGPLHACALAEALDMPAVVVPARAGVLSAVGILTADRERHLVRTWPTPLDHAGLEAARAELATRAQAELGPGPSDVATWVDARYAGQSHELSVASVEAFGDEHERRNGFRMDAPVEVVALRARARRRSPVSPADLPEPARPGGVGPCVLAEADCTIWVPAGRRADPGRGGALVLTRTPPEAGAAGRVALGRAEPPAGRRADQRAKQVDPASLQVLISRLSGVAEEMSVVLRRAAFSPNIKERADCSAAVFDASGELLAQAENIPVHLGSMPASVRAVIDRFGVGSSDALGPGDQAVVNDPFAGGTHLNDITLVAPCFVDGRLVGWVANRAHHADVGGAAPGSLPPDATDIQAEGLRLPPVRFTDEVRALILANSRTPGERAGDLDAQVGANAGGVARLAEVAAQAGGDRPGGVVGFGDVLDHGQRRMEAVLAELPVGRWTFVDQLDSFGSAPDQQEASLLTVAVTVGPDSGRRPTITFDFTGSDDQRAGNVNAVEAVTISAVAYVVRAALDPTLPANGGVMRPVRVVAPAGTIVNATEPAAVGAGNVEVSQRVADVCFGALAQVVPDHVGAASQGTMNNVLLGGGSGGTGMSGRWVYYETLAGGQGGRPSGPGTSGVHTHMSNTSPAATDQPGPGTPGMSGIHTAMTNTDQVDYRSAEPRPGQSGIHTAMTNTVDEGHQSSVGVPGQSGIHTNMTNTKNTPIEALERAFPMRVLRQRLRRGSGGAGWSAGGEGIERDLQVLVDATVSLITERRVSRPWGLAGGEPGAVGENWLLPGGDESKAERLPDKCTIQLKAGDVLRMLTPGGGGWGPPTR